MEFQSESVKIKIFLMLTNVQKSSKVKSLRVKALVLLATGRTVSHNDRLIKNQRKRVINYV